MKYVIPISEAKANLSKLFKRAHAGEAIHLGAYGRADAVLAALPESRGITLGAGLDARIPGFEYEAVGLIESDPDVTALFDEAIDRDAT